MFSKSRSNELAMAAQGAADSIEYLLLGMDGVDPEIDTALVLGDGWDVFDEVASMPLRRMTVFTDMESEEHRIAVVEVLIEVNGKREMKQVIALITPLYQNEAPDNKWLRMSRIQIEMLIRLRYRRDGSDRVRPGIKRLILCDAGEGCELAELPAVIPTSGFYKYFERRMPLAGRERRDPNSVLDPHLFNLAIQAQAKQRPRKLHVPLKGGEHVFVHGPSDHSSNSETALLKLIGVSVIGEGLLPWAYLAALKDYQMPTLALSLVMSNMEPGANHEQFMARATEIKPLIRSYMSRLFSSLEHETRLNAYLKRQLIPRSSALALLP